MLSEIIMDLKKKCEGQPRKHHREKGIKEKLRPTEKVVIKNRNVCKVNAEVRDT